MFPSRNMVRATIPVMGRKPPACGVIVCHWRTVSAMGTDIRDSASWHSVLKRVKASAFDRFMNGMPNSIRSV